MTFSSSINQGSTDESWGISDLKFGIYTDYDCEGYTDISACNLDSGACSVTTVYEECDYGGRSLEVDGAVDCLEW